MKGRNGYTKLGSASAVFLPGNEERHINFMSPRGPWPGAAGVQLNREDFNRFQSWVAGLTFDDMRSDREKEIGSIAFAEEQRQ